MSKGQMIIAGIIVGYLLYYNAAGVGHFVAHCFNSLGVFGSAVSSGNGKG